MKVTFDIECTPDEARQFLGLPNVAALQDRMMKEVEEKMRENMQNLDPETFIKTWLPLSMQGWGDMQKIFFGQMGMPGMGPSGGDDKKPKAK